MKHYLNVCDVRGDEVEPVDAICFGSPCQDLSVAGKRKGLKHSENGDEETTRSGLFMEAVRIIKEMRLKDGERAGIRRANEHIRPRFAVWENVPGAFSSNKGEDFRVVLEELARVKEPKVHIPQPKKGKWTTSGEIVGDGWSIAWRTLDAQFHGVPQRRRRIFLVADFAGECAGEILFECEGLPGYPPQSGEKRETTSGDTEKSIGTTGNEVYGVTAKGNGDTFVSKERHTTLSQGGGQAGQGYPCVLTPYTLKIGGGVERDSEGKKAGKGALIQTDLSATLSCNQDQTLFQPVTETICFDESNVTSETDSMVVQPICMATQQGGAEIMTDKCPTITAAAGMSGNNQPVICYNMCSYESNAMKSSNPNSGVYETDKTRTLDLNGGNPACNQGGTMICKPLMFENHGQDDRYTGPLDVAMAVCASYGMGGSTKPYVVEPISIENHSNDSRVQIRDDGTVQTLTTRMGTGGGNVPLVGEPIYTIDRETFNCGQNFAQNLGISESEINPTLVSRGPSAVAVPIGFDKYNQAVTGNVSKSLTNDLGRDSVPIVFKPRTYQETIGTLTCAYPEKLAMQDVLSDMFVTEAMNWDGSQVAPTLTANGANGSQRMPDKDNFNCVLQKTIAATTGEYMSITENVASTLLSRDYKDPQIVCNPILTEYIVRRLTPTECARLQGMPNWWCDLPQIEEMSDEDYEFWKEALKTHAEINGKKYKEKTKEQMVKWYNKLHTDSAEYKAYGNGMALPCVRVPIHGIAKLGAKTMGSLFDGIGGFPLAGLLDGIETLWCAEVEPFPIAVTKVRFK